MANCTKCHHELADGAKFCFECGEPVVRPRKMEYVGTIRKCPSCGQDLPGFTAVCPSCGHEMASVSVESSLSAFMQEIRQCEEAIAREPKVAQKKRGWANWGKGIRTLWVFLNIFTLLIPLVIYLLLPMIKPLFGHRTPPLTLFEQKKAALIENYVVPNEREAILEALLYVRSKMDFVASEKYSAKTAYWMRLWDTKAAQLQQKAEILLHDDVVAATTRTEMAQSKKKVQNRVRIRAGVGVGLISFYVIVVLFSSAWMRGLLSGIANPFKALSNPFTGHSSSFSGGFFSGDNFEWIESTLSKRIPTIEASDGHYWKNTDTELDLRVEDISYARFESYVNECKEAGFTVGAVKETSSYAAYDAEGYYLKLESWAYSNNAGPLDIKLLAPVSGDENFVWPDNQLSAVIPKLEGTSGELLNETKEELKIKIYGVETKDYLAYTELCMEEGYTIQQQNPDDTAPAYYSAFSEQGYKIQVNLEETKCVEITVIPPPSMKTITWPSKGLGAMLPKPKSNHGHIESDSDTWFGVYIGNTTEAEFNAYMDACLDAGFDVEHSKDEDSLYTKNDDGVDLKILYEGNNTMHITVTNWGA